MFFFILLLLFQFAWPFCGDGSSVHVLCCLPLSRIPSRSGTRLVLSQGEPSRTQQASTSTPTTSTTGNAQSCMPEARRSLAAKLPRESPPTAQSPPPSAGNRRSEFRQLALPPRARIRRQSDREEANCAPEHVGRHRHRSRALDKATKPLSED